MLTARLYNSDFHSCASRTTLSQLEQSTRNRLLDRLKRLGWPKQRITIVMTLSGLLCSIEGLVVNRSNFVSVKLVNFIPFIFTLMLLSACGSSGNDGENGTANENGTENENETENIDELINSNESADADGNTDSEEPDNATNTDTPSDSADTGNSVCAGISDEVAYEIGESNSLFDGLYVPSLAPGVLGWDGSNYCDLTSSKGVEDIALLVPFSPNAPQIDGEFETSGIEWLSAAVSSWSLDITDATVIRNLQFGSESGYTDGARAADWAVMHDGTYLYINVTVRNEGVSQTGNIQTFLDSDNPRDDDSIDIFIDGDNSKGTEYDGTNDYHLTLAHLDRTFTPEPGSNSAAGLDIIYRTNVPTNEPFFQRISYEIQINLSSAGIEVGVPFGFDIQLNEDDNGGLADARFAWREPSASSQADRNPSVFATVVLTGCSDPNNCNTIQSLSGR